MAKQEYLKWTTSVNFEIKYIIHEIDISCFECIKINHNKHGYRQSQVQKQTSIETKWAECSLITGAGYRIQVLVWSSIAQSVCGDLVSQTSKVRILHSAEDNNLSP